jgi:hypothetical protein
MGKVESAKIAAAGLPQGSGYCSSIKCILNWTKVFLETEHQMHFELDKGVS